MPAQSHCTHTNLLQYAIDLDHSGVTLPMPFFLWLTPPPPGGLRNLMYMFDGNILLMWAVEPIFYLFQAVHISNLLTVHISATQR